MPPGYTLYDDALDLLKTLGQAATTAEDKFVYRPLEGYPLGWLLHPGLRDGLSVIAGTDLAVLERAGLVRFEPERNGTAVKYFILTADGWQCYARTAGGSDSSSPPSDDPTLRD